MTQILCWLLQTEAAAGDGATRIRLDFDASKLTTVRQVQDGPRIWRFSLDSGEAFFCRVNATNRALLGLGVDDG